LPKLDMDVPDSIWYKDPEVPPPPASQGMFSPASDPDDTSGTPNLRRRKHPNGPRSQEEAMRGSLIGDEPLDDPGRIAEIPEGLEHSPHENSHSDEVEEESLAYETPDRVDDDVSDYEASQSRRTRQSGRKKSIVTPASLTKRTSVQTPKPPSTDSTENLDTTPQPAELVAIEDDTSPTSTAKRKRIFLESVELPSLKRRPSLIAKQKSTTNSLQPTSTSALAPQVGLGAFPIIRQAQRKSVAMYDGDDEDWECLRDL